MNLPMNNFHLSKIIRDIETIEVQMNILIEAQEAKLTAIVALVGRQLNGSQSQRKDSGVHHLCELRRFTGA